MTFFPLPDFVNCVTFMTLSPNKKNLFVCEQHSQGVGEPLKPDIYMSIYDLKNPEAPKVLKAHINVTELVNTSNMQMSCTLNDKNGQWVYKPITESQPTKEQPKPAKSLLPGNRSKDQGFFAHCSNISFTADVGSKQLIAIVIHETPTDNRIVVMDPYNQKIRTTLLFQAQSINKVTFSASDRDVLVTSGDKHFRVWRIADKELRAVP